MSRLVSNEAAKEKWCPFVKVSSSKENGVVNVTVNRSTLNFNCLGVGCMAWISDEYGDGKCGRVINLNLGDYDE